MEGKISTSTNDTVENSRIETDLSNVLESFFNNIEQDNNAAVAEGIKECFLKAVRANRKIISPESEIIIIRAFIDAR